MNTAEELLKRVLENWDAEHSDPIRTDGVMEAIREYLATEEINTSPEPNPPIGARLPNGAVVTNVYEAYEEGLKERATPRAQQEPVSWWYSPTGKSVSGVETSHHTIQLCLPSSHPAPKRKPLSQQEISAIWIDRKSVV